MEKVLKRVMKQGGWAAIYVNKRETDKFIVGKVMSVDKYNSFMILFDEKSLPESLCLCAINTIYRVEQESIYLKRLQETASSYLEFSMLESSPWDSFLRLKKNNICCFLKSGEQVKGVLDRYSRNAIILSQANGNMLEKQATCVSRDEIAMLTCDY